MLINFFIYSKVAFLNFYYLPVIIGGYYLGRRLAVLGALFYYFNGLGVRAGQSGILSHSTAPSLIFISILRFGVDSS